MGFSRVPWTEGQKKRARKWVSGARLDENGCLVHPKTGKRYHGGRVPKRKQESLADYKARMKRLRLSV